MRHAMRHENGDPANRRLRSVLYTMLALAFGFAGLAAIVVVGPGRAIDVAGTYVFPVAAILAVGLCVLVLLMRLTKKLPGGHDLSDWWQ